MIGWSDITSSIKTFLNWFISKPIILLGIAISCIVILALPEEWRIYLGYDEIIKPYRGWISLVALVSTVFLVTRLINISCAHFLKKWKRYLSDREKPSILRNLSPQEKSYVAKYIKQNLSTLDFELSDGVITGLELKGIVYQASKVGTYHHFDYNLKPWVIKILEDNADLKDDILKHYEDEIYRI